LISERRRRKWTFKTAKKIIVVDFVVIKR